MSKLSRQDADLHHEDGSHKATPSTTNGSALEAYEKRLIRHLEQHAWEDRETTVFIEEE